MKITCDYCGKTFKRSTCKSEFNRYKHHFCNNKCFYSWMRENRVGYYCHTKPYHDVLRLAEIYKQKKELSKMFI